MANKIIHFIVGERTEQAEFRTDAPVDDVKGEYEGSLFRPVACFCLLALQCSCNSFQSMIH